MLSTAGYGSTFTQTASLHSRLCWGIFACTSHASVTSICSRFVSGAPSPVLRATPPEAHQVFEQKTSRACLQSLRTILADALGWTRPQVSKLSPAWGLAHGMPRMEHLALRGGQWVPNVSVLPPAPLRSFLSLPGKHRQSPENHHGALLSWDLVGITDQHPLFHLKAKNSWEQKCQGAHEGLRFSLAIYNYNSTWGCHPSFSHLFCHHLTWRKVNRRAQRHKFLPLEIAKGKKIATCSSLVTDS